MEKRIVLFGLLSMAIVIGYYNLQVALFGVPEQVAEVAEDEVGREPVPPPAVAEVANGAEGADADAFP